MSEENFKDAVNSGDRFKFGKNWASFLKSFSNERLEQAKQSLTEMTGYIDFENKSFLDMGCGSGLFSYAAHALNAAKIHSVDFDPSSVKCAEYLRTLSKTNQNIWSTEEASVLDKEYLEKLPKFDIVYSWGVLHHTGNMNLALENIIIPVKEEGLLFIAIYNDEGIISKFWLVIKKIYNKTFLGKILVKLFFYSVYFFLQLFVDIIQFKNPARRYSEFKKKRGMSMIHDWDDWLGGLPFEVASPEKIVDFYISKGFSLKKIRTTNRLGCNQYVFQKE